LAPLLLTATSKGHPAKLEYDASMQTQSTESSALEAFLFTLLSFGGEHHGLVSELNHGMPPIEAKPSTIPHLIKKIARVSVT